jgi:hypothetical protein
MSNSLDVNEIPNNLKLNAIIASTKAITTSQVTRQRLGAADVRPLLQADEQFEHAPVDGICQLLKCPGGRGREDNGGHHRSLRDIDENVNLGLRVAAPEWAIL